MLVLAVVIGLGILAVNVAGLAAGVLAYRRISATWAALVTPPEEGKPSAVQEFAHGMALDFSHTLFLNLKQQLAAPMTHITRQENLITEDLTQAALDQQAPQWSALLGLLPKNVQKRVLGNPAAAAALVGLLGKMGSGGPSAGGGPAGGSGNGGTNSVQMRLRNMR